MPKKKVEPEAVTSKRVWYEKKQMIIAVGAALTVLLIVGCIVAYRQYQSTQRFVQEGLGAKSEMDKTIELVSILMAVPQNEIPTFATVSDKDKLKAQPFFAAAENGDKVLIYQKSRKAILYRPTLNKIINVTDLNITAATPTPLEEKVMTEEVSVAIYNGTRIAGLAGTVEAQLKAKYPALKIVQKINAKKRDYTRPLVVDLNGKNKGSAQRIAAVVMGEIGVLPAGEVAPLNADILVIAAK